MQYIALATDYDGTLSFNGKVGAETLRALERLLASGRHSILVTGRELNDLRTVFSRFDLFHRVIAENGAVLYRPESNEEVVLCRPASQELIAQLRAQSIPVSVGRAIVASVEPHEEAVREAIRDLGLELQITLNRDSVMVLPTGVNKATGLARALADLGISPASVVAVGDAENDHALLAGCGFGAAVANAIATLKEHADLVTRRDSGAGVVEVIDYMLADELPPRSRHAVL